jgi:hypothetical protein
MTVWQTACERNRHVPTPFDSGQCLGGRKATLGLVGSVALLVSMTGNC